MFFCKYTLPQLFLGKASLCLARVFKGTLFWWIPVCKGIELIPFHKTDFFHHVENTFWLQRIRIKWGWVLPTSFSIIDKVLQLWRWIICNLRVHESLDSELQIKKEALFLLFQSLLASCGHIPEWTLCCWSVFWDWISLLLLGLAALGSAGSAPLMLAVFNSRPWQPCFSIWPVI